MEDLPEESISLLPLDNHSTSGLRLGKKSDDGQRKSWSSFLLHAVVVIFAAEIALYLYISHTLGGLLDNSSKDIPLQSAYMGLEDLYRTGRNTTTNYPPIANTPRIAGRVSKSQPKKVFPLDQHRRLMPFGTVSSFDRRVQVTEDIHTLVQFRATDFGMERCALALQLPHLDARLPEPFVLDGINNEVMLDVCVIDTPKPLDLATLSWMTRPNCARHVGTLLGR
ncbi:hypothetical protein CERSUDRAFT_144476, partial [Gelatoporia subvermispora B]